MHPFFQPLDPVISPHFARLTSCVDYRAAASVDLGHNEADLAAGRKVACPVLALWGGKGYVGKIYNALETWCTWTDETNKVSGHALPCGHFLPEEAPEETLEGLLGFFR